MSIASRAKTLVDDETVCCAALEASIFVESLPINSWQRECAHLRLRFFFLFFFSLISAAISLAIALMIDSASLNTEAALPSRTLAGSSGVAVGTTEPCAQPMSTAR